ncbi:MAG: fasciclin domain-containing protein [Saprospiraceae bacterium]|nr:fasciclin domain-containing protein [Saprospiraceae bacterium]
MDNLTEQVNGKKVNITIKDGKTFVTGSEILASINTSNGMIHVIGDVLLPK